MSSKSNEPHLTGLTDQEVLKSREQHGVNLLTPPQTSFYLETLPRKISGPCHSGAACGRCFLSDHFYH